MLKAMWFESDSAAPATEPAVLRLPVPGGDTLVVGQGLEGGYELAVERVRHSMEREGVLVTPEIEAALAAFRAGLKARVEAQYRGVGITPGLQELLSASRKAEAVKLCERLSLAGRELVALTFCARDQGWRYRQKHRDFYPDLSRVADKPYEAPAEQFFRRFQLFKNEWKHRSAHLLQRGAEWHCFFFTDHDIFRISRRKGPRWFTTHWKHGTHVHYVSHLWGLDVEQLWARMDQRDISVSGEHIRYDQYG
jgi:hypothetical protein